MMPSFGWARLLSFPFDNECDSTVWADQEVVADNFRARERDENDSGVIPVEWMH